MPLHSHDFEAIGTTWSIATEQPLSSTVLASLRAAIDDFDRTYSRFRADSLVAQVAKEAGNYNFPQNARHLFVFYRRLYDETSGKVTPLVGAALERAGYDASYSFKPSTQHALPIWDEALVWRGSSLHTTQPVVLDVGAAGKGYLIDIVSSILNDASLTDYIIDASGDLRHKGSVGERIGLEHPLEAGKVIGVIDIQNESLAASAVNRRRWGNEQHHIYDPDTLAPTRDILATWVVAEEAMVADGLATALFFVHPSTLNDIYTFQYVRMHSDGHLDYSYDLRGELF